MFRRTLPAWIHPARVPKPMKYVIVIPDGCADEPQASLGGKTPLEAARTPNMDRIAQTGVVGRSNNVPASLTPASDVATLSLFGYDPLVVYTGRAPLETAAMGIPLGPNDWAIRCNLVTVENDEMRDFTAGHIGKADGNANLALGPGPGAYLETVRGGLRQARGDHQCCGPGARRRRPPGLDAGRRARRYRLPGHRLCRQGPGRRRRLAEP